MAACQLACNMHAESKHAQRRMAHECTVPLMQVGCQNDIIRFTTQWSHVSAANYPVAIAITPSGATVMYSDEKNYFVWNGSVKTGSAFGAAIPTGVSPEAACVASEQEIWFGGYYGASRSKKCI